MSALLIPGAGLVQDDSANLLIPGGGVVLAQATGTTPYPVYLGATQVTGVYLGSTAATGLYLGATQLWP